jgi:hypothetical protein
MQEHNRLSELDPKLVEDRLLHRCIDWESVRLETESEVLVGHRLTRLDKRPVVFGDETFCDGI